jgi:hypothetical protein
MDSPEIYELTVTRTHLKEAKRILEKMVDLEPSLFTEAVAFLKKVEEL